MDGDDGVAAVVLAAEHLLGLAGVDFGGELVEPAWRDRRRPAPPPAPTRRARPDRRRGACSESLSATSSSSRRRRCSSFCAAAWSFQKSGSDDFCSIFASSSAGLAASKIAPQIGRALGEILIPAELLVVLKRGHAIGARLLPCWRLASPAAAASVSATDSQPDDVADPAVDRATGQEPDVLGHHRALEHVRALQHAAVGIDEAADAGVGGARQVAPFLDRAQRRLLPVLVGRRRPAVPGVVGDRRQQLAAVRDERRASGSGRSPRSRSRCWPCARRPAAASPRCRA